MVSEFAELRRYPQRQTETSKIFLLYQFRTLYLVLFQYIAQNCVSLRIYFTFMHISYLSHSLVLPVLAQLQATFEATIGEVSTVSAAENADFLLAPATAVAFTLSEGWEIVAVPQRAAIKPALLAIDEQIHFENFTRNMKIGVFSALYQKMLMIHFPQVEAVLVDYGADILFLLEKKEIDGMFLPQFEAQASGFSAQIVQKCSLDVFTPQAGEGIVFLLGKKENPLHETLRKTLHHTATALVCEYEKAFEAAMKPHTNGEIFAYSTLFMDTVMLNCGYISENESLIFRQKSETKTGNMQTFIKNTVENVLLNK